MDDGYITRYDAFTTLTEYYHHSTDTQHGALREALSRVPAADVRPVVHAHWIERDTGDGDAYYECSHCGEAWTLIDGTPKENNMAFCSRCGAVMDEDEKEIILPSLVIGGKHYEGYLQKACNTTNEAAMRVVQDDN